MRHNKVFTQLNAISIYIVKVLLPYHKPYHIQLETEWLEGLGAEWA